MSVVTRGVVSIEDGKKADTEYTPARKVRVELTFDVPEGEDADTALAHASGLAEAHVRRLLGQTTITTTTAPITAPPAEVVAPATDKPAAGKRQAGPRAKPEGKPAPIQVVLKDEPKADPSAITDEVVDDFSAPAEAPAAITDAELHSAAQKKNGEIKNPKAIRELVAKFRPNGKDGAFQLIEIPAARRGEFLTQLKELTA